MELIKSIQSLKKYTVDKCATQKPYTERRSITTAENFHKTLVDILTIRFCFHLCTSAWISDAFHSDAIILVHPCITNSITFMLILTHYKRNLLSAALEWLLNNHTKFPLTYLQHEGLRFMSNP